MKIENRVAIVTGAGRGIGKACALRLAQDGADVLAADIDQVTAQQTANEIRALGRRSLGMGVDVSKQAETREMAARAQAEFGRIDILVNNAGIMHIKSWLDLNDEDLDRLYAVNFKSVIYSTQAVARYLTEQCSGRIVNMASMAAKTPRPLYIHYAASKAAVVNVTRALALYFAPYGVTCNSVCPGTVDTKMWEYIDEETGKIEGRQKGDTLRQRIPLIPLGRVETPADVADVVAFLSSDDSRYMTGQSLVVDGGVYME
ncbi:MAG: SDR family oxidoreductase [Chloroflexi bacterium]|nr:SDR family oxidoreductase [Chloroflexota bacterium]